MDITNTVIMMLQLPVLSVVIYIKPVRGIYKQRHDISTRVISKYMQIS
jgi:hypothetical protein